MLVLTACSPQSPEQTEATEREPTSTPPVATATPPAPTSTSTPTPTVEAVGVGGGRDVIRSASDSVVRIETDFAGGTGFAVENIDEDLVIVTNAHVIDGASVVHVIDSNQERWPAVGVYRDQIADLAVLEVPGLQLPPLRLSDETPEVTDDVWVIGFPLLIEGEPTVTSGVVSSNRMVDGVSHLQIDAAINTGNSGGPVLDQEGELVGVATWKYTDTAESAVENIGFALTTSRVLSLLHTARAQTADALPSVGNASEQPVESSDDSRSPPNPDAPEEVRALLGELPGSVSAAIALPDASMVEQASDRPVPAGSIIKLWIAAAALDEWHRGGFDLASAHTIRSSDQAPGTGILNGSEFLGQSVTFGDLIEYMLLYSDNSAANIIVDRIGGIDRVNQYIGGSGYTETALQRRLGYLDPASENYTSARDSALFIANLLAGSVVNEQVSGAITEMLDFRANLDTAQLDYFGRNLPSAAHYAHMSGFIPGARNEVGFVLTESGQLLVIVLLLTDLSDESAGEQAILSTVEDIYYLVE